MGIFRSAQIFRSEHVSIRNVPLLCPFLLIICHSGLACPFLCFVLTLRHSVRDTQIQGHLIFLVAPNINGTLVWDFLRTVLLAPRFLENLRIPALRYNNYYLCLINGPPLWSSGQGFWLQIQRSRVRFPALPDFLSGSGSGTGCTQPREVN